MPVAQRTAKPRPGPPRRLPARPKAITSLQDAGYTMRKKWLVYGGSGAGKTVMAGTCPDALLMTTEPEGAISAKVLGSTAQELKVATWEDWLSYMDWLERGKGASEYDWICPDSLDELEELAWNSIMRQGGTARSIGGAFRQRSRNDYPLVWSAMKEQVDRLCRLPTNVLITCKTMRVDVEDDDGEDTTLAMPLVGSPKRGDLSMKICGQMTLVGYYRKHRNEQNKVSRRLHTEDSDRWLAKDRHDTFGPYVVRPNVVEMCTAIEQRVAKPGPRTSPARAPRKRATTRGSK